VGVERLPLVSELRDGSLLAIGHEDRVVAETLRPAGLLGDASPENARAAQFPAVGCDQDELADVARRAVLDALELAQQLLVRLGALPSVARRANAGPAPQSLDLEPGVFAERPRVGRPEERLRARVLVVRLAGLERIVSCVEQLELPVGQQRGELPQLVPVLRAEQNL
jgi:hypothetical protein